MPTPPLSFKRLVLALQPAAAYPDIRFAAEIARLLQLDLLALLLDDLGLSDAARIPFTREFRGPLGGWQPIDTERIRRDLQTAGQNLRRSIEEATRELEATAHVEVLSGPLAETIQAISRAGDILMLAEPANPAERASAQFNWLTEAVLGSPAALLLVPARIARHSGPVVAIAAMADDPSIHAAAEIATACGEELVIIDADHVDHGPGAIAPAGDEKPPVRRLFAPRSVFPDPALLNHAFRDLQERLVVMSRGAFDDAVAFTVGSVRRVPVLLIEAGEAASGRAAGATKPASAGTADE